MGIIKKNQLTILVLALMLVTAGYFNYNENMQTSTQIASIGDATLVSSNIENSISNINENNNINYEENVIETQKNVQINTQVVESEEEYFIKSRLERETMYSQMLEAYQKILESTSVSDKQKDSAQMEIDKINKNKNSIMISENLIKTKGIEDLVIFINDESVSVVIKKEELGKEDIAQIQSIIAREIGVNINNIHIMNK